MLIFACILALSAGFFACEEKAPSTPETLDKDALALSLTRAAFQGDEAYDDVANALLSLLSDAGTEDAESIALLSALKEKGDAFAEVYLDIKNNSYTIERAALYRDALSTVAASVGSPEVAGRIYYAAAKKYREDTPYTLSDCEKLAALLLGQNMAVGGDILEALLNGNTDSLNQKEVNTLMLTLVSAFKKAVGISPQAKEYLLSLASSALDELEEKGADPQISALLEENKAYLRSLLSAFLGGYDAILSFTSDFFDKADASLFMGLPYEKEERVVYYGYKYDGWKTTIITKEQYDARSGGYDEYIAREATVKGFTVDGTFIVFTEEDARLADNAYRLYTAYTAYLATSPEAKSALQRALDEILTVLSGAQDTLSYLFDRELIENSGAPAATFDELIAALPALSSFNATDGIGDEERSAASQAISTFESFLHGYLPKVF